MGMLFFFFPLPCFSFLFPREGEGRIQQCLGLANDEFLRRFGAVVEMDALTKALGKVFPGLGQDFGTVF